MALLPHHETHTAKEIVRKFEDLLWRGGMHLTDRDITIN